MNLGTLDTIFSKLENDDFVFATCFGEPMSYRGFYDEVAFEPSYNRKLSDVKSNINKAFTEQFEGYKGGEYSYDSLTTAHIASYGNYSEESEDQLETIVGKMLIEYYSV